MRKAVYLLNVLFLNICCFAEDAHSVPSSFTEGQDTTYIFDSVNVITGEYTEAQNDLRLSGPEPFILRRYHTRNDCFLYGWHCNLPNLINSPMTGKVSHFTSTQKISYEYDKKNRLKSVKTSDLHDQTVYNWMNIQYSEDSNKECSIQTHDGQQITYRFLDKYLIAEVISSHQPSIAYNYQPHPCGEGYVINRRELPEGRFVENEYYEKDHPYAGKVKTQKSPVGCDSTPIITHRFVYHEGYTEEYDAINCKTIYSFSNGRITGIANYDYNGKICRTENLIWAKNSQLKTRYIANGKGTILTAHTFSYDDQGHLIKDTTYGNLSGTCIAPIEIGDDDIPVNNGIESYSVSYEYSDDLLMSATEDNGKKILYRYWSNSPNLYAKLISVDDKILLREFYFYNYAGQIIKIFYDNGSSENADDLLNVSERHIKKISYRTAQPAIGLPESIEEAYLDLSSGQEALIKKTINHYNTQAKVIQQDIYDADNHYLYSIHNEYDGRGRLLAASDATGNHIENCYDLNNNLIKTTSVDAKGLFQEISNSYDFANRLISSEALDNDNNPQKVHYQYDVKGNKTAFIDECGNKTTYEYDSLGREVKVIFPKVFDAELNVINPTKKKSYDVLNRIIAETDAKGLTTYVQYNARGKPIAIIHPNKKAERFFYNLDGSLKISFDQTGCYTVYHRDPLGRINKTEIFEQAGVLHQETSFIHNAFHLLEAIDSSGQKIGYKYNEAGRLLSIEQQIGDTIVKRITYGYNNLGLQTMAKEWFGENLEDYIVTIKEFDSYSVLKSTLIESSDGKQQKILPSEETNASSISREDSVLNSLDQQVIRKSITDQSGNTIITIFDAIKRPIKVIRKNILGEVIGLQELRWDVNNHKVRDTNYLNNESSVSTIWTYDSNDRLIEITEDFGTSHPKHTKNNYNEDGQLISLIKPDGVTIFYQYTPLGDILRLYSSDNTIDYTYAYDHNHNITNVIDNIHSTATLRTFSAEGSLLDEQQGNGLTTSRKYDELNRCVRLSLTDNSSIDYKYESLYLKEIHRQSSSGNDYTHTYKERDSHGRIQVQEFAGNVGQKTLAYDDKGHVIAISTPYWSENITYSTTSPNTIIGISIKDPSGDQKNSFSYDAQDRLTIESGFFTNSFTYNWLGNQTSKNQSINPLNQPSKQGSMRNPYDLNGNLKEKVTPNERFSFEYDALNRMTAMRKDNGEVYRYIYDAFHRRLSKACYDAAGNQIWEQKYLYDGLNEIGAVNEKGEITELRILGEGLGAEIGSAIAMEFAHKVFIPIHDHRGSVCSLVDIEKKKVVEHLHFSAFGEEDVETSSPINPWRFSSKRSDQESGLVYFGKRYYDPSTSQWTTQDPLRPIEGPNYYAFASNNPLSRIDPYGLFSFSTLWQNFYSRASSLGQKSSDVFFTINDFIHDHLSIEYNFKNKIEDAAVAIFGKINLTFYGFYNDNQEVDTLGQGELNNKVRITLINGIINARHDLDNTLEMISKAHGGNNIHYIFRPTEGWTKDLVKATLVKFGWVSPQAKQLAVRWKELIEEMGGTHGGGKIIHYAHSLGSVDTFMAKGLLSPEELSMIKVYTFGSPSLLNPGGFQSVTNYVSKGDGVSYLDPIRYIYSMINHMDHVSFIPSSWAIPFIDHQLTFPAYQSVIESLGKQFLELYVKK